MAEPNSASLSCRYGSNGCFWRVECQLIQQLSEDMRKARVQVKHISGRASLIQFAALRKRRDTKGDRKKQDRVPVRRGSFVDVKTIAAALLSRSFSLASLADFLKTQTRKASTDQHGGPLSHDYLGYAVQDVQATWECFCVLSGRFDTHGLSMTPLSRILSEASIGKAYLKQMNIRPWQELQPDAPKELNGLILSLFLAAGWKCTLAGKFTKCSIATSCPCIRLSAR